MPTASIEHIEVDEQNVARIVGKRTKVIQIVMDKMANGWDAETIHAQYPYLSLAEIHAARHALVMSARLSRVRGLALTRLRRLKIDVVRPVG